MRGRTHPNHLTVAGALMVVILAACSDSPGGDTVTSQGDTSEAVGPGDFMLPDPLVGLTNLYTYRSSLLVSFEGTVDGVPQQWTSTSEMLRTANRTIAQVTVENTGALSPADPSYLLHVGGTEFRRDSAGTCTAAVADPNSSLVDLFEPARGLAGVLGAEPLGDRVIGGIDVVGYDFDERAVGQAGIADTRGEVWVAADGGYVVEYTMTSVGGEDLFGEGAEGTVTWTYQLSDMDQSVVIEVPDDCPPGVIDAPTLADASGIQSVPGMLTYDTASTSAEVLAFYQAASVDLGWSAAGEAAVGEAAAAADYTHGDDVIALIVLAGDVGSKVYLVVSGPTGPDDEPGGSGGQGDVTFEMTGSYEAAGSWVFAEEFSFLSGGTLTFTDPANPLPEGSFLTLSLAPGNQNLSFSDGTVTIIAGDDVCTFEIDHQDASGAAGTVTCTDAVATGPGGGGIDIVVTFDVRA